MREHFRNVGCALQKQKLLTLMEVSEWSHIIWQSSRLWVACTWVREESPYLYSQNRRSHMGWQQNYATVQASGMRFSTWKSMKECFYRRLLLSFWHRTLQPQAQWDQVQPTSDQVRGCTRGSIQRAWNSNCFYSINKYLPTPATWLTLC